jgi:hypothetical protein
MRKERSVKSVWSEGKDFLRAGRINPIHINTK